MTEIETSFRKLVLEIRFARGGVATWRERRESRVLQAEIALQLSRLTGTAAHVWTRRAARAITQADIDEAAARRWAPLQGVLRDHFRAWPKVTA